jgi:tRNA(fMet)-specific endonuclease VapC
LNIIKLLLAPFPCVPFDEVDATYYATTIRHDLELRGEVVGPYDLQIAAICLRHGFVLVTNVSVQSDRNWFAPLAVAD